MRPALTEGRRRPRACISLRALLVGALLAVPMWTVLILVVIR